MLRVSKTYNHFSNIRLEKAMEEATISAVN